jgi:hypothetical protein
MTDQSFVLADAHESGSFIITEANFWRSRGAVLLAAGCGQLKFGTVLGNIASTNLWVPSPVFAYDGSHIAAAILWEDTDASGPSNVIAGAVMRNADVYAGALTYDPSVALPADQQMKWIQLAAESGIIVREQDDPEARAANQLRLTLGW